MTDEDILRVLIIEDDPTTAGLLDALVQDVAAIVETHQVHTIQAAAAWTGRHRVDLALLDLNLPDSPGLETLTTWRATNPGVPTIVVTGQESVEGVDWRALDATRLLLKSRLNKKNLVALAHDVMGLRTDVPRAEDRA